MKSRKDHYEDLGVAMKDTNFRYNMKVIFFYPFIVFDKLFHKILFFAFMVNKHPEMIKSSPEINY